MRLVPRFTAPSLDSIIVPNMHTNFGSQTSPPLPPYYLPPPHRATSFVFSRWWDKKRGDLAGRERYSCSLANDISSLAVSSRTTANTTSCPYENSRVPRRCIRCTLRIVPRQASLRHVTSRHVIFVSPRQASVQLVVIIFHWVSRARFKWQAHQTA